MIRAVPLLVLAACAAGRPGFGEREVVGLWVTRWDYRTPEDVRRIVENCASLGATDILWQCRGAADAYYRSGLEPWGVQIGGKDPGFDPLELAVAEAHAKGVRIHAWMNVMPLWRGKEPPPAGAIAAKHPEWIVVGRDGRRQPPSDHYLCANPANDEWVGHVVAVVRDVAARYDVDGIHLDYIRFLEGDFSYDRPTLDRFGFATGRTPDEAPEAWTQFRRDLVTRVVELAREAAGRKLFTAAVYPTAEARRRIHQDAERWVRDGLVDAVWPMQYREKNSDFEPMAADARAAFGAKAFPGLGVFVHKSAERTGEQIDIVRRLGAKGFALFCYQDFFETGRSDFGEKAPPDELRAARRALIKEKLHARP